MPSARAFGGRYERYLIIFLSPLFPQVLLQVFRCSGVQVQVQVDGVPWVIKPGDYMSSFFLPPDLGVGEDVGVGEDADGVKDVDCVDDGRVGGGGGLGGKKFFKRTDKLTKV